MKCYDFRFGDQNAGYFTIAEAADHIRMVAIFKLGDEVFENAYELRLADGRVTHYKAGDNDWQPLPPDAQVYPTSAYSLLVGKVSAPINYLALQEATGELIATELRREGDCVIESSNGKTIRQFWLDSDEIVKIDWGGPISALCTSLAEAKAGSDL